LFPKPSCPAEFLQADRLKTGMHPIRLALPMAMLTTCLLPSCSDEAPRGDNATISEKKAPADVAGTSFVVDTTESRIRFTGHGVGKNHPGVFRLSSGTVSVNGNQITGGHFVINIRSMELEEKGGIFDEKLRPHLISGDFFDAGNFGSARFEITGIRPYQRGSGDSSIMEGANFTVSGNLTLKDVSKNLSFPARIELDDRQLKAKGNFDIDRRQWNMNYGNDKTLGEKFISEKVNIRLDLEARKS